MAFARLSCRQASAEVLPMGGTREILKTAEEEALPVLSVADGASSRSSNKWKEESPFSLLPASKVPLPPHLPSDRER